MNRPGLINLSRDESMVLLSIVKSNLRHKLSFYNQKQKEDISHLVQSIERQLEAQNIK